MGRRLGAGPDLQYYSEVYSQFNSRGASSPRSTFIDEVRNGSGNYDVEVGYSNPIFDRSLDLRLKFVGYRFAVGNQHIDGLKTGAQLTTRDGVFRVAWIMATTTCTGPMGLSGPS